jgi:hypothetical protein
MNFYIVFCKTRKKFDKFIKINRIRNKVIVDIKEIKNEENIIINNKNKDYFNLMIYTKISHAMQKGKSIYYIPDFTNKDIDVKQVYSVKNVFNDFDFEFNALVFFKEFINDNNIKDDIFDNLDLFDNSQLIEDY